MKTMSAKLTRAEKLAKDIKFVKMVASDLGHTITDADAKKCIKHCKDDYYAIKEYFTV